MKLIKNTNSTNSTNIILYLFILVSILNTIWFLYYNEYKMLLIFISCCLVFYFVNKNIIFLLALSTIITDIVYLSKNKLDNSDSSHLSNSLDVSLEKFKKRFIINNQFTPYTCNWIIEESKKYALTNGWTNNRHKNYPTTDIPIKLIPCIFSFLMSFKENIYKEIQRSYSLDNCKFEILDIFIVKYDVLNQKSLEIHTDVGCISVNILLNDQNEFVGGGTYFKDDDITVHLNQGDMLIHSAKTEHSGVEITQGKRYVLVFFIDVLNNN